MQAVMAAGDSLEYHADFELPVFSAGSIDGQNGWTVQQGRAEVEAGAGRASSAGLVLVPVDPFSQTTLVLESPGPTDSPSFLDLQVSPTATGEDRREEMLDLDGARIGFFRSSAKPEEGRFWIFNGDGGGGGDWQATAIVLPVNQDTGRPQDWARMTVREDFERQTWDLWINGRLAADGAGFQEPVADHSRSYMIMGDTVERLVVDDLTLGGENPLGPDQDRDGILDTDESR